MKSCLGFGATKCAAFLALAGFALTAHAASVFTFDADNVGTSTQFTDTVGGIPATFLSPSDPGGFQIQPTIFQALNGNVLGDPGPAKPPELLIAAEFFDSKIGRIGRVRVDHDRIDAGPA